jgi:hypothetical protein
VNFCKLTNAQPTAKGKLDGNARQCRLESLQGLHNEPITIIRCIFFFAFPFLNFSKYVRHAVTSFDLEIGISLRSGINVMTCRRAST